MGFRREYVEASRTVLRDCLKRTVLRDYDGLKENYVKRQSYYVARLLIV